MVSFDYATGDGTATQPADYADTPGSKTIAFAGSQTTITVPVAGDALDEFDETFTVGLSNINAPNTIGDATGQVTITDDDLPAVAPDPDPVPVPSNEFDLPKTGKANTKKGKLTLDIDLPGAGVLEAEQAGGGGNRLFAWAKSKALIKPASVQVAGPGTAKLVLKPSKTGLKKLKRKAKGPKVGKLNVKVDFTFTPTGGTPGAKTGKYKLKLR